MKIKELDMENFRGYSREKLSFVPGINLLCGENAQGKTNILEAAFVCATGKSFRTNHDQDLVKIAENRPTGYKVKSWITSSGGDFRLAVEYDAKMGKRILLNSTPLSKRSELLGYLTVVVFTPEDLNIIKGGPSHRRRFVDLELAQINPGFRSNYIDYAKLLQQRNNLLRQISEGKQSEDLKEVFDLQLVELASKLTIKRISALQRIANYAAVLHQTISEQKEHLSLEYVFSFPLWQTRRGRVLDGTWLLSEEEVKERLLNYIQSKTKEEIYRGQSLYGPHRDDINLLINEKEIRTFGSQGQQRTATLALKLAELEYMREQTGEYPVLLLDDVLSELDASRRKFLMDTVREQVQVLVTTTEVDFFHPSHLVEAKIFEVCGGRVRERLSH